MKSQEQEPLALFCLTSSTFPQFSTDDMVTRKRQLTITERVPFPQDREHLWEDTRLQLKRERHVHFEFTHGDQRHHYIPF